MGKLMFYSLLAYGHQNVGLMISNYLLDKYGDEHQIYMLVDDVWKNRLQPQFPQFTYVVYENPNKELENCPQVNEDLTISRIRSMNFHYNSPEDQMEAISELTGLTCQLSVLSDEKICEIIENIKPDLIITDQMCASAYIMKNQIPWALLVSCNPLIFGLKQLPPACSGLKMNEKEKWMQFQAKKNKQIKPHLDTLNDWYIKNDCRELRYPYHLYESPYFNIYCFPKEIDYFELGKIELPGKWLRLDSVVSPSTKYEKLKLPEDFLQKPGKIIYFSLGSLFSAHYEVIQKFLDIFEKLPHKFIVSKGPLGDSFELPENCWGDKFVNQKSVLQAVDLIISHGGNNTLSECFHYGVPMIIVPFFVDQHDNGTRIQETGYGIKLNPFNCTESEVINAIDFMLNNKKVILKWKQASLRIQQNNGIRDVAKEILSYIDSTSEK